MRSGSFENFIHLGDKENKETFFVPFYSNGVKTNRDAWVYNFNIEQVVSNMSLTIALYCVGLKTFKENSVGIKNPKADDFIDFSQRMITWTREIKWDIEKGKEYKFLI